MTRDEILALPAGRELDAEAAKRLGQTVEWWWGQYSNHDLDAYGFIWQSWIKDDGTPDQKERLPRDYLKRQPCVGGKPVLHYSTDNGAACQLIEYITEQGGLYGNDILIEWWNDDEWYICNQNLYSRKDELMQKYKVVGRAQKLAHAITLFFIGWDAKQKEYWGEDSS